MRLPEIKPISVDEYEFDEKLQRKEEISYEIKRINEVLQRDNEQEMLQLHKYLDGKYQECISGWGKSMYGYIPDYGFNYDVIGRESLAHNLEMMAPKLEAFFQGWNIPSQQAAQVVPEINVNTTTNVNITITFEQVRSKIEDMTSLTDEQTKEALEKVSEIESVVKGEGSKKSKWEKIKPILTWLADKSFDVAMTILPLLLQVQG